MKTLSTITFRAMGCGIEARLETGADSAMLLDQFRHDLETMEAALTRFHPDSELSHLNRHSGTWVEVSPLLFEVLQAAHQAALLTEGMFNPLVLPALIASGYDRSFELLQTPVRQPTHPAGDWQQMKLRLRTREVYLPEGSALDLGGIGKGWAADKFASQLAEYGAVLVNIGGDIAARGQPEGQPGWLVDVSEPGAETIFTTITLTDGGIVTTALDYRHWMTSDGQQQHHIIDPRTGQPARTDVYSVTIRHPRATLAEAFAKAVMLRGSQAGLGWLSQQWDTAALVVRNDGAVLATSNWQ